MDIRVQEIPLKVGIEVDQLLRVDKDAPVREAEPRQHIIEAGLGNGAKCRIDSEIRQNAVADIVEHHHIGGAGADIRLKGTPLVKWYCRRPMRGPKRTLPTRSVPKAWVKLKLSP